MNTLIITMIAAGIFAGAMPAQEKSEPRVAVRKENQQKRIAQGVKSGQLTPGETAKLERKKSPSTGKCGRTARPMAAE